MALNAKMGSAPYYTQFGSFSGTVSGTTFLLDSNFVNAASGDALTMHFSSPVDQTNAALTIHAFMTARTGSPTAMKVAIYAGPSGAMDPQRPDTGAALATSAAVDVSAQATNSWTTFSISSVSLTAGATYFAVLFNDTATPASNNATYMSRGLNASTVVARWAAYTTTNGFTTDPAVVATNSDCPFVIKFSDDSLLGCPYVVSTAHASNTDLRGIRLRFDAQVVAVGAHVQINSSSHTGVKLYDGASEVASVTYDRYQINNSGAVYFDTPVTLSAATDYDLVVVSGSANTAGPRYDGGTSPPADVDACMPTGVSYVTGASAGSLTAVEGITAITLLIDNFPAAAGGGGGAYAFGD